MDVAIGTALWREEHYGILFRENLEITLYFIVSTGFVLEALNACQATVNVPIITAAMPIKINDAGEISFL